MTAGTVDDVSESRLVALDVDGQNDVLRNALSRSSTETSMADCADT
jgi:hypothetical protein